MRGFLKTTQWWSLFFLGVMLFFSVFLLPAEDNFSGYISADMAWGVGGPISEISVAQADVAPSSGEISVVEADFETSDTLFGASYAVTKGNKERSGIKMYKVKKGDTPASVAAQFAISVETIISANLGSDTLKEKNEIPIPPVSGTMYEVRSGDSLYDVARSFRVNVEAIKSFNPEYEKAFTKPGTFIVIPDTEEKKIIIRESGETEELPALRGFFALPAKGWNWGKLHDTNAVDIANACGTTIFAAAAGVVVEESGDVSWNDGYGNFVLIEHENGVRTRYAHTTKNLVKIGDVVSQRTKIALMGNTGNTQGTTGCHVHFEVLGAKNPFALQ